MTEGIIKNGASSTLVMMREEDLITLARTLILETKSELESTIAESNADKLITTEQAAELLGVNRSTLWKWAKRDYLKPIEVGGKRRYRLSAIKAIIAGKH